MIDTLSTVKNLSRGIFSVKESLASQQSVFEILKINIFAWLGVNFKVYNIIEVTLKGFKKLNIKDKKIITLIFSSLAIIGLFASSASPIPLYGTYSRTIGLTTENISLTAVFYFLGCICSLLFLTGLSDIFGRKTTGLIAVGAGILGLILLIFANNGAFIIMARLMQGLSCGLASNVFSLSVSESGEGKVHPGIIGIILSSAIFIGLALGGLLSGGVVQMNPSAAPIVYWILLCYLFLTALGLLLGEETKKCKGHLNLKIFKPNIGFPSDKRFLLSSSLVFISSWAMGGYFQAYSSSISNQIYKLNSPLLSAIFLISYMVPNAIGSHLSSKMSKNFSIIIGMAGYIISVALLVLSLYFSILILTVLSIIFAGTFQGIAYRRAMQNIMDFASENEKVKSISYIYVLSYAGAGIPSFISGKMSQYMTFLNITIGYLFLVAVLGLMAITAVIITFKNGKLREWKFW